MAATSTTSAVALAGLPWACSTPHALLTLVTMTPTAPSVTPLFEATELRPTASLLGTVAPGIVPVARAEPFPPPPELELRQALPPRTPTAAATMSPAVNVL